MSYLKVIATTNVSIHKCKNSERNLYSCNANIYFKQKYSRHNTISDYVKAKKTQKGRERYIIFLKWHNSSGDISYS
jgi:hypothetical protein